MKTNPNAMETLSGNGIFTNTALTDDGDVWWEGMTDEPPAHLTDWRGNDWTPASDTPPPIPTPASPCRRPESGLRPGVGGPRACPSPPSSSGAGGRSVVPLVTESFDWAHGVFLGSIMASETTAAAAGAVGNLRRDPFAMLPFCGYNMADYFGHWLRSAQPPTTASCPGLLRELVPQGTPTDRSCGPASGRTRGCWSGCRSVQRPREGGRDARSGICPAAWDMPTEGLNVAAADLEELLRINADEWRAEIPLIEEFYGQ